MNSSNSFKSGLSINNETSLGSNSRLPPPPPPPPRSRSELGPAYRTAAKVSGRDRVEPQQGGPVIRIDEWQKPQKPILRPVLKAMRSGVTRAYRGVSSGIRSLGQYEAVRVTGTIACIAIATCVGAVIGINCITVAGGAAVAALVGGLATAALMQVGFVVYLGVKAAAKYFKDKNWNW